MRSTGFAAIFCFLLLTGCAAKSSVQKFEETKQLQPHTVEIYFNKTLCAAYFIQNDAIVYEFNNTGKYNINPGKYLYIAHCSNGTQKINKKFYEPGTTTTYSFAPGANPPPVEFGINPRKK